MNPAALPPLRWWGWGDREVTPPPGLMALLRERLDVHATAVPSVRDIETVQIPDSALSTALQTALAAICGARQVRVDASERIRHAAGRSYSDLLRLRGGHLDAAPDAVVYPGSNAEVARVLAACAEAGCAVVPFGGGTSVVGGVAPLRGGCAAVIALDLQRLGSVLDVDTVSQLATVQAGMRGPQLEAALAARNLTLGHFPQSFEYATVGGFAATRSAGQASTGHGRFDEMASGLRLVSPAGELIVPAFPATAAGPSLLQMALGSEGAFGVITEVTLRVRRRPALRRYAGWSLPDLESGVATLRELAQRERLPDVARLSDVDETGAGLAMSASRATALARRYLRIRGHRSGCLLILGWEGDGVDVGTRARRAAAVLRGHGAVALGSAPGRAWLHGRYDGPYLRDALLDRGVLVETLETAAIWSRVPLVHQAVGAALRGALAARGTPALVGCHVSHVYGDGASLYFTVIAAQERGRELEQWHSAKTAATEALLTAGGTLTHHHAVGVDHAAWLPREIGDVGTGALRALRAHFDAAGIMNPGKLVGP